MNPFSQRAVDALMSGVHLRAKPGIYKLLAKPSLAKEQLRD